MNPDSANGEVEGDRYLTNTQRLPGSRAHKGIPGIARKPVYQRWEWGQEEGGSRDIKITEVRGSGLGTCSQDLGPYSGARKELREAFELRREGRSGCSL